MQKYCDSSDSIPTYLSIYLYYLTVSRHLRSIQNKSGTGLKPVPPF